MMRKVAIHLFIFGLLASPIVAQSIAKSKAAAPAAPTAYDTANEAAIAGRIVQVISVDADGTVGVHLKVKTTDGLTVQVHVGPAMFIGMNNFFFLAEDNIAIRGAYVSHGGEVGMWARQITKGSDTLTLRNPDGTPRWPSATAEDPDGCGLSHVVIRY